eukprot:scaffold381712_cov20-Prasinocladus_malaysianus.AAC.1
MTYRTRTRTRDTALSTCSESDSRVPTPDSRRDWSGGWKWEMVRSPERQAGSTSSRYEYRTVL